MWSPGLTLNSIQKNIGSVLDIYWGGVINRTIILGIGGAANLSHTVTNFGYLQLLAQYVPEPDKLLHYGGEVVLGLGSVKDYEHPKTNLFDNFLNISGAAFYFVEPRLNGELNITKSAKLVLGLGYTFAFGLDEQNKNIVISKLTNKDLSGVRVLIGVKLGKY